MTFRKITKGKDEGKYRLKKGGKAYTLAQVKMFYARGGFRKRCNKNG